MAHWRTDLLPYLVQIDDYGLNLSDAVYQLSRPLSAVALYPFQCLDDPCTTKHFASYFAIINPDHALLFDAKNISVRSVNTIVVLEAHNQNAAWTDSKNLSFEEAVELLTTPSKHCHWREGGLIEKSTWVRNVLFADGAVRSLNMPLPRELSIALLTANGGETIDPFELARISNPELDYKKIYSLAIFVLLSLLPTLKLGQLRKRKIAAI